MERGLEPVKEDSEIPESRMFQIFQLALISQGPSSKNTILCYTVQLYEYFNLHVLFID
uniref:Uncharacterized protein n=1 Tax=Gorilla gorilla gorilla TaxID=9595 RepID=A0A2I2YNT1_GORGO